MDGRLREGCCCWRTARGTLSDVVLVFKFLFIVAIAAGGALVWTWISTTELITQATETAYKDAQLVLLRDVQDRAQLLSSFGISAFNLARVLTASVPQNLSSFSDIEKNVNPTLFLSFSSMQLVSQISFVGNNGLSSSYYMDGSEIHAIFSNTTEHRWFGQAVHADTGITYGNATDLTQLVNASIDWIGKPLGQGFQSVFLAQGFHEDHDPLFLFTAPVGQHGFIFLGVYVKFLLEYEFAIDIRGGGLYIATTDGVLLTYSGLPYADVVAAGEISDPMFNLNDFCITTASLNQNVQYGKNVIHFRCDEIYIGRMQLVSISVLPCNSMLQTIHSKSNFVLLLCLAVLTLVAFSSCLMIQYTKMYKKEETYLRASLIKQKEATQQAERKSMNKSLAFARANHDLRTSLAAIQNFIVLCQREVPSGSGLNENLVSIGECATKLLGIVNSILDISKVEAGKMQLEEVEFDMAQVLEQSVNCFQADALAKGLELMWDPCDCSILKLPLVKGDCRRLKQVLDNLLGNAMKFTPNGHVLVRAWARRISSSISALAPCQNFAVSSTCASFSQIFHRFGGKQSSLTSSDLTTNDTDCIEFIFEVDDTGIGIPKEKRVSVFENYVQVKETSYGGQEGTGLGLGIVQSYVRLMGGEITILDKLIGEKGTCFRFSIRLNQVESSAVRQNYLNTETQASNFEVHEPDFSNINTQPLESANFYSSAARTAAFNKGLKQDGINICAVQFIQGDETKKISQRWMENMGVKVCDVHHLEHFTSTLENIKHRLFYGPLDISSIRSHSGNFTSCISRGSDLEESQATIRDGLDNNNFLKRSRSKNLLTHVVVIIDVFYRPMSEICLALTSFTKCLHARQYKIVWLANWDTPDASLKCLGYEVPCDLVLRRPFHGSRLYKMLRLLQGFGSSNDDSKFDSRIGFGADKNLSMQLSFDAAAQPVNNLATERDEIKLDSFENKPLNGMTVLVVEDSPYLRKIAVKYLSILGASAEVAENGVMALKLVRKAFREFTDSCKERDTNKERETNEGKGVLKRFPYDLILMDCEMPEMNGYEAAKQIRIEERFYGLKIPIIALSAYTSDEQGDKLVEAGIDFHLMKPLKPNLLIDAIHKINAN